jgi:hypothetical protein
MRTGKRESTRAEESYLPRCRDVIYEGLQASRSSDSNQVGFIAAFEGPSHKLLLLLYEEAVSAQGFIVRRLAPQDKEDK